MKSIRNSTWALRTRPSLLMCSLAMRAERRSPKYHPSLMADFEEAERQLAAALAGNTPAPQLAVKPTPLREEPVVKRIIPVGVEAVDDDPEKDEIESDRRPLDYVASVPAPVAGEDCDIDESDTENEVENGLTGEAA
jgi:hypothetical protein